MLRLVVCLMLMQYCMGQTNMVSYIFSLAQRPHCWAMLAKVVDDILNVPLSSEQQDLLQMFSFATEKNVEGTRILQHDIRGSNLLIRERKSHQPRLSDWQLRSDSKSA